MNTPTTLPAGARILAANEAGTTLRDLAPGESCVVRAVRTCEAGRTSGDLRRRLLEMGFVSGTEVRIVRVAPLADPIEVVLHGYHLSLRRSEAETILVTRN